MNENGRKMIVAVTGASGSIYARLLLDKLRDVSGIDEIAFIVSGNGAEVAEYENVDLRSEDVRIKAYEVGDLFSPPASGSACYDSMVIIPCSAGTMGKIASGIGDNLITRAADVMLKERRKLLLVLRETPLNGIHIDNMARLTRYGAVIVPASPSFYSHPKSMEELCMTVVERVISLLGLDSQHYEWNGK